ncbi:putative proton pump interactor [Senna tora]|uniref:Putative proton pump interactor n=1 Tax=Senna tora TaxID=362788 RepID=A0A834XHA4_9FABA|nr:putative proton pump interactor [Senna tora]
MTDSESIIYMEMLKPFYFVKIWPKDAYPKSRIKEAVKLFQQMDQLLFQISEKIKTKEFERERVLSRLNDLKYCHERIHERVEFKKNMLKSLNLEANEACRRRATNSSHKLNLWMLHRCKKLSDEKKFLRDMNSRQQREAVSISTLPSKQSMRNTIKAVCDELMEMRKEKKAVEAKIKNAEKRLEAIKEEIWCSMEDLKDEHRRNDAYVCILEQRKVYKNDDDDYWVLKYHNLESMHSHNFFCHMENPETNLTHNTPSRLEDEADNVNERYIVGSDLDSLPFCYVIIWPQDVLPRTMFKEALKLFEKRDQRLLHISEKIRDKVDVVVCDELTKMKKEKQRLEAIVEDAEKEFEGVKEEIWCHIEHLKDKHHRSEASVCVLQQRKVGRKDRWFFEFCYLESIHTGDTKEAKSAST